MNVPAGIRTNRIPIEFSKATGTPAFLAASICSGATLAHAGTGYSAVGGAVAAGTEGPRAGGSLPPHAVPSAKAVAAKRSRVMGRSEEQAECTLGSRVLTGAVVVVTRQGPRDSDGRARRVARNGRSGRCDATRPEA